MFRIMTVLIRYATSNFFFLLYNLRPSRGTSDTRLVATAALDERSRTALRQATSIIFLTLRAQTGAGASGYR